MNLPTPRILLAWSLALLACRAVVHATPPDETINPPAEKHPLNPALSTIWIAGDSTAAKNNGHPIQGWGVPFAGFWDPAKVNVANRARGGRSTRTFIAEGLWDELIAQVKAGDQVLIQFGHNDGSPVNEDASVPREKMRSRGSLPGLGDETREIDNVVTGKHEVVHTFGWYVRRMIADVKARGATPILLSLTVRNYWKDGHVERGSGHYREWDRALAEEAGIAFVDLTRLVADEYEFRGEERVRTLFAPDHVHTNPAGAELNATEVVAGLKGLRRAAPFPDWLSAKGRAVEPDKIGWLNLPEPADPKLPTLMLIGDSTVRNGRGDGAGGQWGWGDFLDGFFDTAKINLVNRAVGGTTGRTFLTLGYWPRARLLLKPSDFVVIQFGTNDGGPINEDASVPPERRRARGSLPGTGEETQDIVNIITQQPEVVHTNGWYLRKFVREARAAGATPILCSLVPRKIWKDGRIVRSEHGSAQIAREVAEQEKVPFIDLNNLVAERYEELGPAAVDALFADEHTHTSQAGAVAIAGIVARALRQVPGDPLGAYVRAGAR
ncbi:MAG TPA: rhamnogalacturonan acetylesterase [Lacunisphaera sp.]|jgi:lysophospholipase L1-like esterase|nr:rhamnogalacturonan acetylesterase [Lacunisphaera sp.]